MSTTLRHFGSETLPYVTPSGVAFNEAALLANASLSILDMYRETKHLGFCGWLHSCDITCQVRYGFGIYDFPDQTWRDWYDQRIVPLDAVRMLMENEHPEMLELDNE